MLYQHLNILQSLCGRPHAPSDSPDPPLCEVARSIRIWVLFGIGTYHYHDRKNLGNLCSLQIIPVYFTTTTCSMYSSPLVTGSFSKVQSQELFRVKNLYPVLSSLRSHRDLAIITMNSSPFVSTYHYRCNTLLKLRNVPILTEIVWEFINLANNPEVGWQYSLMKDVLMILCPSANISSNLSLSLGPHDSLFHVSPNLQHGLSSYSSRKKVSTGLHFRWQLTPLVI